jgi:simple sugar transport system substrate-binding protein/basic membrane protein A
MIESRSARLSAEGRGRRLHKLSWLVTALASVWLSLGSTHAHAAASDSTNTATHKAAMLFPGSVNDQSWNQSGYEGLLHLKRFGFEVAYSENVSAADHVTALRDYAHQGYNLIIGHSGRFLSAEQRVASAFPDIQFVTAAGSAGYGRNVLSVDFNNRHFGCLLGVLAARMSRTGKVAGIYGLEGLPTTVDQAGSFRICAKRARPSIQVTLLYVMDIEDAAAAAEAAYATIAAGTDVLVGQLNAGQVGLLQAAKARHVFVTGRSLAQTAVAPDQVLTNVIEKWPEMYQAIAKDVSQGRIAGAYRVYGLDTPDSSGADLRYSATQEFNAKVSPEVVAELQTWKQQLANHSLVPSPKPEDAHGGQ